ncbi:MAG TPA: GspE/PulE family protein [Chlamydiales bacterium]|nr:GspE/PulE family protein [Chlamydiales bacterium]
MFENFSTFTFDKSLTKQVPYSFVKKHLFLPIMTRGSAVLVATFDPFNMDAIEELRLLLKANIETIFVPKHAILAAIHECYTQEDAPESTSNKTASQVRDEFQETDGEIYDLLDDSSEMSPAIKLINFAVGDAIQQNASDIHFEPEERGLIIRYRIDGALQVRLSTSNDVTQQLLTRLKVMAKLDIAERRLPQDGRVKMRLGGKIVDFRVSTVPTVTGERIVLRILDKGNIVLGLDKICMPPDMLQRFREGIDHPEGIILVTGPTGSGKTTTLYSALTELKNDDTNIMTIEDPVEYRLQGIAQIGIHPKIGLTFAAGLRHILRQDPDIIMIGEIRDRETAEIAIQAALTGHLVLSTLHTNDAPSAIVRLVDMGIEPYLISSCVIGVLAQRLVRKICPYCRISYEPSKTERTSVGTSITELYKGKGCPECLESGFKGRQGIYELMTITGDIRKQILISPEATALHNVATRHGMKTLRDHGMQLIQEGTTTLEEVWRATKSNDE